MSPAPSTPSPEVPLVVARHLAPVPVLHLGLTSKVLWIGGPDTGKTTHAKHVAVQYPRSAIWDPGHEWTERHCRRHGYRIARTLRNLERAARLAPRVVLQPPRVARGDDLGAFDETRRELGDAFAWWCLDNLRGPCFVYFDEPHTIFRKGDLSAGLAELLRRGHKDENRLAMGWSAWGARELPNDLENVSHLIAFRPNERNDVQRIERYFGPGFGEVAQNLPDYWHIVRQKDPATRTIAREVFRPIPKEAT